MKKKDFEMLEFSEMESRTREFYEKKLNIKIKDINLAVASLTMTEYAKIYSDKHKVKIDNQDGLATVGDAVCGAYVMLKEYKPFTTKGKLTDEKNIVTNEHLKIVGKKLLEGYLFYENNDLKEDNKKDYATAFEAIIGFIALNDINDVGRILKEYLK